MTSPIIVGTRKARQARLGALGAEVAQIKAELQAEREGGKEGGMEAEATSRIEEFDSLQLEEEKRKADKLKEALVANMKENIQDLKKTLGKELREELKEEVREDLMLEQQVLFLKARDELTVKLRRDMEKVNKKQTIDMEKLIKKYTIQHKKQTIDMEKLIKKYTIQHQEQMFLKMTLNHKTNVHSRGTQVEVGELESQPLPETFDIKMEENQDDSFSLLAS